jgi:hypothetical protein
MLFARFLWTSKSEDSIPRDFVWKQETDILMQGACFLKAYSFQKI